MKNSSLDAEPLPKFGGKKEVTKETKNLPGLIFSMRNGKNLINRDSFITNFKNLEKEIKNDSPNYSSNETYSNLEKSFLNMESNQTSTSKDIKFTKSTSLNSDMINEGIMLNYPQKEETNFSEKKIPHFYGTSSSYLFAEHQKIAKENVNKEKLYSEFKEKEKQEVIYVLLSSDEPKKEEGTIFFMGSNLYKS